MRSTNPTRRSWFVCLFLAACIGGLVSPDAQAGKLTSPAVEATLIKVVEIRRVDLVKASESASSFDPNPPRLELTFLLVPPANKKLVEAVQPESIRATDSTGLDLTAIKENVFGHKPFVQVTPSWNEPPKSLTLTLLPPERSATRFTVDTDFDLWAYDEMRDVVVTPGSESVRLAPKLFGDKKVMIRLKKARNGIDVVVTPGSIKPHIEKVELHDGETALPGEGAMWNDASLSYHFKGAIKPTLEATFKIRVGMAKLPCRIALYDPKLP